MSVPLLATTCGFCATSHTVLLRNLAGGVTDLDVSHTFRKKFQLQSGITVVGSAATLESRFLSHPRVDRAQTRLLCIICALLYTSQKIECTHEINWQVKDTPPKFIR